MKFASISYHWKKLLSWGNPEKRRGFCIPFYGSLQCLIAKIMLVTRTGLFPENSDVTRIWRMTCLWWRVIWGLTPYGISFHVGSQQRDIGQWNDAIAKAKWLLPDLPATVWTLCMKMQSTSCLFHLKPATRCTGFLPARTLPRMHLLRSTVFRR